MLALPLIFKSHLITMFEYASVLTLNWTPAVLLPVSDGGYDLVFHPLSSAELAGSFVLPVAQVAVVPPIKKAAPTPPDGTLVPVLGFPSGGLLWKFHSAIEAAMSGEAVHVHSSTVR